MVSDSEMDSELVCRLWKLLSTSDLNTTTTSLVRRKLEEDLGIDLSDKKAFIRKQVNLYLQSQFERAEENEEGDRALDKGEENEEAEDDGEASAHVKSEEEEEEEEDGLEDAYNGKGTTKRGSKKQKKEVKKRGGFCKLCSLSPELQKFVGVPKLARTEVVKQLWSYIREKNLHDPCNRRNIICDDTLRALFSVDSINMFQMNKALTKHIWPLDSDNGPVKSTQKEKQRKQEREGDSDEPRRKEKRKKGGNSGFLVPLPLSDALVKFLGTGENALPRCEVVKRVWEYIKQNNLQHPSDKRRVICDEKLIELFDVDSFKGFEVSRLITSHFIKMEQ